VPGRRASLDHVVPGPLEFMRVAAPLGAAALSARPVSR
jgi:hypothetical protein